MATWLEMRCGGRVGLTLDCWSNENNGPMLMAGDSLADVRAGLAKLREQAKRMNWRRTRSGWLCPVCAKAERRAEDEQQEKQG